LQNRDYFCHLNKAKDKQAMFTVRFQFEGAAEQPVVINGLSAGTSLLEVCLAENISLSHTCGGVIACSSCQVYILEGQAYLEEPVRREKDFIKRANHPRPESRLACQCLLTGTGGTLEVMIPVQQKQ
jgi:2Fe-2S ferredoxin